MENCPLAERTRPSSAAESGERKDGDEQYSDEEAERRATDALRRTLATPYKPHKELVGKVGRKRAAKDGPKAP
jgi:hypothetical protein